MTIRTKLLVFIPLLVLLANSVTFFLFQSGKIVQRSYDLMMDRVLLYNQSTRLSEDNLRHLHNFLINPGSSGRAELAAARNKLQEQHALLSDKIGVSLQGSTLTSYVNMLDTLMEQEQAALNAADGASPRAALAFYGEAEKTTGFIREEGQRLVDLELSYYQPVYRQIQLEHERMNRLGAAVFIINALLGVALAVWISRSVTGPVSRLVDRAREISRGNLHVDSPALRPDDELGILSDSFDQMTNDLRAMIEKEKESLEKDRLVKELELQALQSQINPHFLFNTLNVLSKLALLENAEKTSDLIVSVSNLLRYNLRKLDQPVTLRDELGSVMEYITIQQARFRDRFRFETDIEESALQVPIPSLTLQPIVENAFVHGIKDMEEGAVIRLEIKREPGGVRITVSDNGQGMSDDTRQALLRLEAGTENRDSAGIGTKNVFKRLQLFYEQDRIVGINSRPGEGTTVTIRIPTGKGGGPNDVSAVDRR